MSHLAELGLLGAERAYPPFLANGQGACAEYEFPDDFTEDGGRLNQHQKRARAIAVCGGCPFKRPCREWAIATKQQGVYGGTTTKARRSMR